MTPATLTALAAEMRNHPDQYSANKAAAILEQVAGADAGCPTTAWATIEAGGSVLSLEHFEDDAQAMAAGSGHLGIEELIKRSAHLAALTAQSGELGEIRELFCLDDDESVKDFVVRLSDQGPTAEYLKGHQDGCKWAADLAEANDPRTSDWLYDDPHELAKAIRKGPEMPPAAQSGEGVHAGRANLMRINLITQVHNLISRLELCSGLIRKNDPDTAKSIDHDIAHAREETDPYNYNGPYREITGAAVAAYEAKRGGVR